MLVNLQDEKRLTRKSALMRLRVDVGVGGACATDADASPESLL